MSNVKPGARAFLYARVSKDTRKHDRERSVSQQVKEGRRRAADLEVDSLSIYDRDNDRSASKFAKKTRDDWGRLLADVEAGQYDLGMFWESSRGSRKAGEWTAFIDLCCEKNILVHIIDEDGTYDPREPRDRKRLLEMGVDAEYESGQTRKRILRDKVHLRLDGRPDGKIPFGHQRLYDERTRELIRQEPHPVNRDCIREGVKRVRKGESLRRIRVDYNKRSQHDRDCPRWVPTMTEGVPWRNDNLRRVLMNPSHIGMRRDPEWTPASSTDEFIAASWAPLFDDPAWITEWWAAYRMLDDPSRTVSKAAQTEHLLSYIMVCGICARRTATGRPPGGQRNMRLSCRDDPRMDPVPKMGPGCTSIVAQWAEDYVTDLVIARLSQPEVIAAAGDADDADAVTARARAAALQAKLDEFWTSAMRTDGRGITLAKYEEARAQIEPQILEAKRAAEAAAAPPLLREFLSLTQGAGEGVVRRAWEDELELEARRDIIKLLFEFIRLGRGKPGRGGFEPERISYKWREW